MPSFDENLIFLNKVIQFHFLRTVNFTKSNAIKITFKKLDKEFITKFLTYFKKTDY